MQTSPSSFVARGKGPTKEIGDVCTQAKFKRCLTKVVVTRAGRLWEWSHAEFWLYLEYCVLKSSDTESLTAWRSFTVNGIGQHGLISVNKYFKMEPLKCGINIIISRLSLQPCLFWCSLGILGSTAGTSRNPWLGTEPIWFLEIPKENTYIELVYLLLV